MRIREYEEYMEKVDYVDITLEDFPVTIRTVVGERIRVIFPELSDMDEVFFEVVDRTFRLIHHMKHNLRLFLGLVHFRERVIVEIPSSYRGSIQIRSCNGSVKTEGAINSSEIKLITSNGSIHTNQLTSRVLLLNSKNGSIQIDQIKADDISLETSNGSIKGVIKGNPHEYTISSHTANGRSTLPSYMKAEGNKKLFVKTCNGRIAVDFVK